MRGAQGTVFTFAVYGFAWIVGFDEVLEAVSIEKSEPQAGQVLTPQGRK